MEENASVTFLQVPVQDFSSALSVWTKLAPSVPPATWSSALLHTHWATYVHTTEQGHICTHHDNIPWCTYHGPYIASIRRIGTRGLLSMYVAPNSIWPCWAGFASCALTPVSASCRQDVWFGGEIHYLFLLLPLSLSLSLQVWTRIVWLYLLHHGCTNSLN